MSSLMFIFTLLPGTSVGLRHRRQQLKLFVSCQPLQARMLIRKAFQNSKLFLKTQGCDVWTSLPSNQINSNQTTYPNNHNINNITSGVQYQATTASVNNLKVFPTLRGLRSLPLHLRVSIHMHASNTYTVIVCFLELLLMRVHTLRSNPKIQKPLTPKHCWKHKSQKHSYGKQMLE